MAISIIICRMTITPCSPLHIRRFSCDHIQPGCWSSRLEKAGREQPRDRWRGRPGAGGSRRRNDKRGGEIKGQRKTVHKLGKPKCTHYQGFQHSRRAKRSGDIPEQLLRYHGILVMSFRRQSGHTESGSTQTHRQKHSLVYRLRHT